MAAAKKKAGIVALCATSVALGMGASVAQAVTVPVCPNDAGGVGIATAQSNGAPLSFRYCGKGV